MAAIHAAGPDRSVELFDGHDGGGRKILIAGGGRCNVLPGTLDESRFVTSSSPHLLRKFLRSWPLAEQRHFFEITAGVPLALEPSTGKLFPASNRARDVRDALHRVAAERGVRFHPGTRVTGLRPGARWQLDCATGASRSADAVVVATGGLSVPSTGSDGAGLAWLAQLGHVIHPTYPALTPLTSNANPFADLAGISLTVTLTATAGRTRTRTTGGFLFTHRGFSGPAVLDLSHCFTRAPLDPAGAPVRYTVSWSALGPEEWERRLGSSAQSVVSVVRPELPARLADRLVALVGIEPGTTLAQLRRTERARLIEALCRFELPVTGDEGYRKAEVTGGGVALGEVDPASLESRRAPRLFLAGELLDAFGPIGGYNFAWAWATGRLAGLGAATAVSQAPSP